jgi:hypothetical protein
MEGTISEPAIAGVRSVGEAARLQPQGSIPILARFSATFLFLSLKYKYGNTPNISGRRT